MEQIQLAQQYLSMLSGVQANMCQESDDISCEVIDLRTLLPWDAAAVGEPAYSRNVHVCICFSARAKGGDGEMGGGRERGDHVQSGKNCLRTEQLSWHTCWVIFGHTL